jgi:hypothetical protein
MAPYAAGCSLPLLLIKLDDSRFSDSPSPKCGWLITFNAGLPTGRQASRGKAEEPPGTQFSLIN